MMGIGGAIAAIGVVIFAVALKQADEDSQILLPTYASAVLMVIGAAVWVFVCYSRITLPAIEVAGNQNIYGWTEVVFTLSFIIGIVLMGYISIQKYSKWVGFIVGIIVIVYDVGMSLMTFISFGTVPPAIHYLPIAILGLMLIIKGGGQSRQNLMSHSPELQSQS
jgi:hypothetical protein